MDQPDIKMSFRSVKNLPLKLNSDFELHSFQRKILFKIIRQMKSGDPPGFILAMKMGLGKTLVALSLMHIFPGPHLFICPHYLPMQTWKENFKFFGSQKKVVLWTTLHDMCEKKLPETFDILIISYLNLTSQEQLLKIKFNLVVWDESHVLSFLNNNKRFLYLISRRFTLLMTATPFYYNYKGFFNMVKSIQCDTFQDMKPSLELFQRWYHKMEPFTCFMSVRQAGISSCKVLRTVHLVDHSIEESKFYLQQINRDMKEQEIKMQKKKDAGHKYWHRLTKCQQRMQLFHTMKIVHQPRLITALSDKSYIIRDEDFKSSKVMAIVNFIHDLPEEKSIIVISENILLLEGISKFLNRHVIQFYTSNYSQVCSWSLLDTIRYGSKGYVLLTKYTKCILGLNLEFLDRLIFADLPVKSCNILQAQTRLSRPGQRGVVNIEHFIMDNTVERKIFESYRDDIMSDTESTQNFAGSPILTHMKLRLWPFVRSQTFAWQKKYETVDHLFNTFHIGSENDVFPLDDENDDDPDDEPLPCYEYPTTFSKKLRLRDLQTMCAVKFQAEHGKPFPSQYLAPLRTTPHNPSRRHNPYAKVLPIFLK